MVALQVIEYDPTTLAPLGMVVSRDELLGRKVRCNAPCNAPCNALCNAVCGVPGGRDRLRPQVGAVHLQHVMHYVMQYVMYQVAVIDSGLKSEQCDVFEDGAECVDQSSREQARIIL